MHKNSMQLEIPRGQRDAFTLKFGRSSQSSLLKIVFECGLRWLATQMVTMAGFELAEMAPFA